MTRILLGISLLLALAGEALATEVRLGPEKALTPVGPLAPAESTKGSPAVASNGHDFLAVWEDGRRGRDDLYASRIGRDGLSTEPAGHLIAEGAYPAVIASAGGDYLIAYQTGGYHGPVMTQRLDSDGNPLTTPRFEDTAKPLFLTSNGANYLLVDSLDNGNGYWSTSGLLLDRDGLLIRTLWVVNQRIPIAAGVRDGNYFVVDVPVYADTPTPVLRTVSDTGAVTTTTLPAITAMSAAFSPDRILLTSKNANNEFTFLLTGYDGRLVSGPTIISGRDSYGGMSAYWNGSEFEVTYSSSSAVASISRVAAADGAILDSTPLILTTHGGFSPAYAAGGGMRIVVWYERSPNQATISIPLASGTIMARTFSSLDAVRSAPDQGNVISWSGIAQVDVKVARTGEHEIAVWSDRTDRIFASVNGVPISINGVPVQIGPRQSGGFVDLPAAGSSETNFLIAWHDEAGQMLAERIAFDGRVLDNPPITLSADAGSLSDPNSQFPKTPTSIASDGSTYFVVWSNFKLPSGEVVMARVDRDGTMRGSSILEGVSNATPHAPQVSWTGSNFFVSYTLLDLSYCSQPVYCPTRVAGIGGVPFDATGQPLLPKSQNALSYLSHDDMLPGYEPVSISSGAGRVTFLWFGSFPYPPATWLVVAQTTMDGTAMPARATLNYSSAPQCVSMPAVAWDGAELVAAWIDTCHAVVRAVRLNQFGDPIEAPFDVAAGVSLLYSDGLSTGPSIVPTPDGVVIIYSRSDPANGDAPRAFERSLARLPPSVPRRRPSSH